jgi:hypothetical protein
MRDLPYIPADRMERMKKVWPSSYSGAFLEGVEDYFVKMRARDNPYTMRLYRDCAGGPPRARMMCRAWREGWRTAKQADAALRKMGVP